MHIIGMLGIAGLAMGILAVVFGILVLVFPKILNYLIGIFLIVTGAIAIIQVLT